MKPSLKHSLGLALLAALAIPVAASQFKIDGIEYTVQSFDVPGATSGASSPVGARISDFGLLVGYYIDSKNDVHGYYKKWDQPVVAPFDDPNDDFGYSRLTGVNNFGVMAGGFLEATSDLGTFTEHGFTYKNGTFTDFNVNGWETFITGINTFGDMAGQAFNPTTGLEEAWIDDHGRLTLIPDGTEATYAEDINDFGVMTFVSEDSSFDLHSFFRTPNGAVHPITVSGAVSTQVASVNDFDFAIGEYLDSSGNSHGFAYDLYNAKYVSFDIPGATDTYAGGLNNLGFICGHYIDSSGNAHGYIAYPSFF